MLRTDRKCHVVPVCCWNYPVATTTRSFLWRCKSASAMNQAQSPATLYRVSFLKNWKDRPLRLAWPDEIKRKEQTIWHRMMAYEVQNLKMTVRLAFLNTINDFGTAFKDVRCQAALFCRSLCAIITKDYGRISRHASKPIAFADRCFLLCLNRNFSLLVSRAVCDEACPSTCCILTLPTDLKWGKRKRLKWS